MARIFLSPLIVDIRNKQSDTVFSKWKGINYIRSRVVPHNPKSAAQVAIREALAGLVAMWQDAYPSVKLNWDEWASGRDYSGFNKFIGKNVIDYRDDNLLDLTQEVGFTKLTSWVATTGADTGKISVAFAPSPVPANTDIEIYVRAAGAGVWTQKTILSAAETTPKVLADLPASTLLEVYGYLVKDTDPTGEEVGDDLSDTATSS